MRILILSDVHANADALRALLAAAGSYDAAYCAGDLVDYGPQAAEAVELLREKNVLCVRGNHDERVLRHAAYGEDEMPKKGELAWADLCARQLSPEQLRYLAELPAFRAFEADGFRYLITHRVGEGYAMPENQFLYKRFWKVCTGGEPTGASRLILGHTHRRYVTDLGEGLTYLNPGSVSYRRMDDPDKCALGMVIDGGKIEMLRVPYDRSRLAAMTEALRSTLHPDEYYVGEYFFIKTEEESPYPEYVKAYFDKME